MEFKLNGHCHLNAIFKECEPCRLQQELAGFLGRVVSCWLISRELEYVYMSNEELFRLRLCFV